MSQTEYVRIPRDLRSQISPAVVTKLEDAINSEDFWDETYDGRRAILCHAALTLWNNPAERGRRLTQMHKDDPHGFSPHGIRAEKMLKDLGLIEDKPAAGKKLESETEKPVAPNRVIQKNSREAEKLRRERAKEAAAQREAEKETPADHQFVAEFRAGIKRGDDDGPRPVIRPSGSALVNLFGAEACEKATGAVMDLENPFDRVVRAARDMRAGVPVIPRGLHYFKQ